MPNGQMWGGIKLRKGFFGVVGDRHDHGVWASAASPERMEFRSLFGIGRCSIFGGNHMV